MKRLDRVKGFVREHKEQLITAAIAVPTTIMVVQHFGIKSLNEFLDEKGLTEEYYRMNEDY